MMPLEDHIKCKRYEGLFEPNGKVYDLSTLALIQSKCFKTKGLFVIGGGLTRHATRPDALRYRGAEWRPELFSVSERER